MRGNYTTPLVYVAALVFVAPLRGSIPRCRVWVRVPLSYMSNTMEYFTLSSFRSTACIVLGIIFQLGGLPWPP